MPSVKFNKSDFEGKQPITPGWYRLEVKDFVEKMAKDNESTNFWGTFQIVQDGEFSGLEVRHCFSEKALQYTGGAADYMACFTADTKKLYDMEVLDALKMTVDRTVQGYLEWDPEFRRNQIKDWKAST